MKVIRRAVVRGRGARTVPDDRPADPAAPDPLQHARRGLERVITVDPAPRVPPTGPTASAAPFSVCCAPSSSATLLFLVQRRVKGRSRREGA